jgi:hypothetical protein
VPSQGGDNVGDTAKSKIAASAPQLGSPITAGAASPSVGRPREDEETQANVTMTIADPILKARLRQLRKDLAAGHWEGVITYLLGQHDRIPSLEHEINDLREKNESLARRAIDSLWKIAADYAQEIDEIVNPPKQKKETETSS